MLAAGGFEQRTKLLRKNAFAAHALSKCGFVELTLAHRPDTIEHFLLPIRIVSFQPVLKHWRYCMWEAQDHVAGRARAGLCGRLDQGRYVVICQPGDHRRDQYRSEERRVGKECRSRWSP